ncbi:tripartite tricarboxylate transporter substrate-binding protein [uncultured Salipiger sp.]|uniref:tripartite tricarboxylate transporter substrate-binding protein n=1 Tax=uncultured Salipiger sp. TaxID=499810 RepID=UPI002595E5C4|nr:tripartite tricarboxylate transporter substrate-binding protein [uncultured Salipiger sp.]
MVTTDHGFLLSEHGWWGKCRMPYDEEISHIRLMIHEPRNPQAAGSRCGAVTQTPDIMPRPLGLHGAQLPHEVRAHDLAPLLAGNADWTCQDFTPLWSATPSSFAIALRADDDRFDDLSDLIACLKENPGDLRYSPGVAGGIPHMVGAATLMATDTIAQLVPCPEIDIAVRDMRGGILDVMITNPGVGSVNKDDMKVLAVLFDMEDASATYGGAALVGSFDIDIGVADLSPSGWNGWLVRKDTPEDIVTKLRDAMEAALKRDEGRQRLLDIGDVPTGFSPDQYEEIVGTAAGELEHGQAARPALAATGREQ